MVVASRGKVAATVERFTFLRHYHTITDRSSGEHRIVTAASRPFKRRGKDANIQGRDAENFRDRDVCDQQAARRCRDHLRGWQTARRDESRVEARATRRPAA